MAPLIIADCLVTLSTVGLLHPSRMLPLKLLVRQSSRQLGHCLTRLTLMVRSFNLCGGEWFSVPGNQMIDQDELEILINRLCDSIGQPRPAGVVAVVSSKTPSFAYS